MIKSQRIINTILNKTSLQKPFELNSEVLTIYFKVNISLTIAKSGNGAL